MLKLIYTFTTHDVPQTTKRIKKETKMKLMTEKIRKKAKPLYSTDGEFPKEVLAKYFFPSSRWTWYATEFDGEDTFFGYVVSGIDPAFDEWGTFSLKELSSIKGEFGGWKYTSVERDLFFEDRQIDKNGKILRKQVTI